VVLLFGFANCPGIFVAVAVAVGDTFVSILSWRLAILQILVKSVIVDEALSANLYNGKTFFNQRADTPRRPVILFRFVFD
jgi:hypothetical protein